ncbi:hypothetical protein [Fluviispira multicolorata]|uniref:Lipoprotein n=1 Tax=Fluviispira multicolorata TaxID=2654512 RepID=A0A833N2Q0_9BACT|nr:hypothetical protein [Fluviispira multicolorata]KAB8028531.1 hypothetical protein GCL57_12460 [Fluviispira multicolorata]
MRIIQKSFVFTTLFLTSCGQEKSDSVDSMSANRLKAFGTFSTTMQKANINSDFNRLDSIGKGFKSITGISANRCLENQTSYFRLDPSANIDYQMDLSQQQLLNKIGVGVSATIPVSVSGVPVTISPEANYAREASTNNLSRTGTVTIKIIKGSYTLGKINENKNYILNNQYNESLQNSTGDFYKICGDKVIAKQNAEANLVITTIFRFNNADTKNSFDASVGASIPNPFSFGAKKADLKSDDKSEAKAEPKKVDSATNTEPKKVDSATNTETKKADSSIGTETKKADNSASTEDKKDDKPKSKISGIVDKVKESGAIDKVKEMISPSKGTGGGAKGGMSPELKVKFSTMSQETLKNVTIEVKAIQLGGDPRELPKIIATTCSPTDINSCDKMFAEIQTYAAESFPAQLENISSYTDESSNVKFTRGGYEVVDYSNLDIINSDGKLISSSLNKYSQDSQGFINIKHDISAESQRIVSEHNVAQGIKNKSSFESLTIDEKEVVGKAINITQREEELIQYVTDTCYQNKGSCQNSFNEYSNSRKEQEKKSNYSSADLDNIKAWNLIASTEANWRPVRYVLGVYSSDRMTSDFFSPTNLRGYKKFFIKYVSNKEPNKGYKITSKNSDGISLKTSFRCYNWFSDALGTLWLHERQANETIDLGRGDELVNLCGSKTAFACTFNSDLQKISPFLIQIWAE